MSTDIAPKSFRFSPEEMALLERQKSRHGSYKAAIMAGLRELEGKKDPDWPAELRRLADYIEQNTLDL